MSISFSPLQVFRQIEQPAVGVNQSATPGATFGTEGPPVENNVRAEGLRLTIVHYPVSSDDLCSK